MKKQKEKRKIAIQDGKDVNSRKASVGFEISNRCCKLLKYTCKSYLRKCVRF